MRLRPLLTARAASLAAALATALALALASAGCGGAPLAPHGHVAPDPSRLAPLAVGEPPALRGSRLVVLGRFDAVTTQPVGGAYDQLESGLSPLVRTYFHADGPLELFEHVSDALRAAGLDVRKDYATRAEPTLVEARLRARAPLLVSGTVLALQHDQVRTDGDPARTVETLRARVRIEVRDLDGRVRYAKEHAFGGQLPLVPASDALRLAGHALGVLLARDPDFVRAVAAEAR